MKNYTIGTEVNFQDEGIEGRGKITEKLENNCYKLLLQDASVKGHRCRWIIIHEAQITGRTE